MRFLFCAGAVLLPALIDTGWQNLWQYGEVLFTERLQSILIVIKTNINNM